MKRVFFISLFLFCSQAQLCDSPFDIPPTSPPTQLYDENYAKLNPPLCETYHDGFQRYTGWYDILSSYPASNLTPDDLGCLGGPDLLFDDITQSMWLASQEQAGQHPYVIFQTDFISPAAFGLWNAGDVVHDVRESTLHSATDPQGPWTLVLEMTSVDFYSANAPQGYAINVTKFSEWRQYWKWTIKSTWNNGTLPSVAHPREIHFFTRPHAIPRDYILARPGPFYTSKPTLRRPYYSSTSSPFALYFVVHFNENRNYRVKGVIFTATSVENGVSDATLRLWEPENQTRLCEFHSPTGKPVVDGLCGFSPQYLKTFTFAFIADQSLSPPRPDLRSPVHIQSLNYLACSSWQCYTNFATVNYESKISARTKCKKSQNLSGGGNRSVQVIAINRDDMCISGAGSSTAILF